MFDKFFGRGRNDMTDLDRAEVGRAGEDEAARLLKKNGFKMIDRNYRCRFGEVDIIATDGAVLVFVEVKTRSPSSFGTPAEAVTPRKQGKLIKTARHYISENPKKADSPIRFDVVSVEYADGTCKATLIKDAFGVDA